MEGAQQPVRAVGTAHAAQCRSDYKCTCTIPADSHTAVRRYPLHDPTLQTELRFIALRRVPFVQVHLLHKYLV